MAKFVLKCPKCDTVNKASTFILAKKVIECGACGEKINVKDNRYTSKICPFCGDTFVYDQAKGKQTKCLSCNKSLDAFHEERMAVINCPQCACGVEVGENLTAKECPICGFNIDVQKELEKAKMVTNGQINVIQYEGDNTTFVWKHPIEDFNIGTQLIVHESQEAVFFLNGEALDTFGPGRHTLETENIPILKGIYKLPTGSQTPFHAEVYFINKVVSMGIKWGTASRVRFVDPLTGIPIEIGASGEMSIQVENGRKLLTKMVGTTGSLDCKNALKETGDTADSRGHLGEVLKGYFRAPLMTALKSYLARTIKENQYDILDMDMYLDDLSVAIREKILPVFEEYGVTVPNFFVEHVLIPDQDNPNVKQLMELRSATSMAALKAARERAERENIMEQEANIDIRVQREADRAAYQKRADGFAEADVMKAQGYNHKDEIQAEVQKAYAEGIGQMGSGGSAGAGGGGNSMVGDLMGAMVGMKVAGSMLGQMDFGGLGGDNNAEAQTPATPAADTWNCECGETGNTKNFCMNCGKPKPSAWTCPECGETGNTKNFCMNCGKPKPSAWNCPECGEQGNTKNFCMNCGAKKPE